LASRKIDGLLAVAESIDKEHGPKSAIAVAAHTGKESDCSALVARAVSELGRVDVLVNNAATNPYFGPMLDIETSAWDKTFDVNTKGYFWMARDVANHLRGRGAPGSIVNVASVAGLVAAPMQGVYGMTKAAVIAMTRTLAVELGSSKIRVNAIAPGLVDTKLASAITSNDALADYFTKRAPTGRWGVPDEIAGGALYLASDSASFVTGHTLVIDGGMTIG
jgi:NAD(P)-dependent dehydrogenase (short-subunit alcohol dehydrogenase family)